jgi:hypothetical protein
MSEDRPQYQAERDTVPTNAEIADRLRQMSSDMMTLGTDMQYVFGFGRMGKIGTAMHIGASNLRTWAHEIEEAQG